MKKKLLQKFELQFGKEADLVVFSPGRINLIGEHVDYNDGFVFPAAINKGIFIAIGKSHNAFTRIHAMDMEETYHSNETITPRWAVYFKAMKKALGAKEIGQIPFNAVFASTLPIGAGMSSSAALCVGFLYALNTLKPWKLDKISLAKLAQRTEHLVGVKCGLLDQFSILFSKENNFMKLDCLSLSKEYFPFKRDDLKLMVVQSKVSHNLSSSAYNERRKSCKAGFKSLQAQYEDIRTFRDLDETLVRSAIGLKQEESDCLLYVVQELKRVDKLASNINNGCPILLGKILNYGHDGLKNLYRVTCTETDFLHDHIKDLDQVFGLRQMGGGFGGSMIGMVDINFEKRNLVKVFKKYAIQFDKIPEAFFPTLGDAVRVI